MRAMILAAGLGTRMEGLSQICAKPALPVLGRPVIAWLLGWLARQGVSETAINLHQRGVRILTKKLTSFCLNLDSSNLLINMTSTSS